MKSLNFDKSNAQQEDVLTKAQMKNIMGGHSGAGPCKTQCEYHNSQTGINKFGKCTEGTVFPGLPPGCLCDNPNGTVVLTGCYLN